MRLGSTRRLRLGLRRPGGAQDPSILHFLIASGDEVSSKQLRDDLMTLLIAGHETNAAVLTWTFYLLAKHPEIADRVREEARAAQRI